MVFIAKVSVNLTVLRFTVTVKVFKASPSLVSLSFTTLVIR